MIWEKNGQAPFVTREIDINGLSKVSCQLDQGDESDSSKIRCSSCRTSTLLKLLFLSLLLERIFLTLFNNIPASVVCQKWELSKCSQKPLLDKKREKRRRKIKKDILLKWILYFLPSREVSHFFLAKRLRVPCANKPSLSMSIANHKYTIYLQGIIVVWRVTRNKNKYGWHHPWPDLIKNNFPLEKWFRCCFFCKKCNLRFLSSLYWACRLEREW